MGTPAEPIVSAAERLYPEFCKSPSYGPGSYQPIIDDIASVLIQEDDDDYQGDTNVLYRRDENLYGFLHFGWGSCSGCDSLQACSSVEELNELISSMKESVKWGSAKDILEYINNTDANRYYSSSSCWPKFQEKVQEYFKDICKE